MQSQRPIRLTDDVRSKWLDVIRAMQAELAKSKNCGDAVIGITVLVNEHNDPTDWLEPVVRKIEPKCNAKIHSPERRHLLTALGADMRHN